MIRALEMGATTSKAHNVMMLWALSSGTSGTVKLKISLILDMVRWSHLFPAIQGSFALPRGRKETDLHSWILGVPRLSGAAEGAVIRAGG